MALLLYTTTRVFFLHSEFALFGNTEFWKATRDRRSLGSDRFGIILNGQETWRGLFKT